MSKPTIRRFTRQHSQSTKFTITNSQWSETTTTIAAEMTVVAGVMAVEEAVAAVVVVIITVDETEIIRNNTVINNRNSIRKIMEAIEVEAGVENPVGSEVFSAVVSKVNGLRLTLGRMSIECRKSTREVV
ncbi:hypothetical protein HanXRQr2_Chr12g0533871 [Helianthus annuus]|uniref:Uncharacterized protein n=1 Tax=Helianthus annuus TaxID=4232 RepID=A0A251T3Y8_HELAN|nr:hypothetical protein HanXRQr2_Chr12g0533871 [Helianthus annuus]KAJ0488847.1 hypothetical protein HanHA300_Chr12g0437401 [Helianthus annuus]KAJ0492440.1 hypothetical protein HanIR_Chr12g0574941 [Helianthus annuus]KAJ0504690.1 hypothetical protein HanHA89_Chr12g0462091 [Helianthus annuus]KAJ0674419.1 hypothetical protein HanLR1_Chr12g0439741 [Helianthus annuus]